MDEVKNLFNLIYYLKCEFIYLNLFQKKIYNWIHWEMFMFCKK